MPKPFDSTLKQLLDLYAVDWIDWLAPVLGWPAGIAVELIDVDLSTVQVSADKVFRLRPPAEGLLHLEPQSSHDGDLPNRLLVYNALLHDRYGGPVYSVAILLRPEANASSITGTLSRKYHDGTEYHRFCYSTIRVWELHAEDLLAGPLGALPLALLTNDAKGRLDELIDRLAGRLREQEVGDMQRRMILTSSYILLGLRYDEKVFHDAFLRASGMKESSSYQAILREGREVGIELGRVQGLELGREEGRQKGREEGREEGREQALREILLDTLSERFGTLPPKLVASIFSAQGVPELRASIRAARNVASLDDFRLPGN